MDKNSFVRQCKKNREILEYTYKDISNVLVDVSEGEYKAFEEGKTLLNKDNLERLVKILCIEEYNKFDLNDYIDLSDLEEEEINDLSEIVEKLVGEVDA